MHDKILIFDFDGTIADTFHLTVEICKTLADEFKFKKIGDEDIDVLKEKSSKEALKYLKVSPFKIPRILKRAREESQKEIESMEPIKGLKETLPKLKSLVKNIGILTSNSSENVTSFLIKHDMDFFDFVKTCPKVLGKNRSLKKVMKMNGFKNDDVFYIGDETRDVDAAKKAKIKSIAVTWGYNAEKALRAHEPDHTVSSPEELLEIKY